MQSRVNSKRRAKLHSLKARRSCDEGWTGGDSIRDRACVVDGDCGCVGWKSGYNPDAIDERQLLLSGNEDEGGVN